MYLKQICPLFKDAKEDVLMHYRHMKSFTTKLKTLINNFLKRHRSKKLVGQIGVVTQRVQPGIIGEMRLAKSIAGKDRWKIESPHQARMGRLVKIIEVRDSVLVVERFNG